MAKGTTARHVALLRGVNVGGKNKLPMASLVSYFEELGCLAVRSYIQSGNVVFDAPAALAARVSASIAKRIAQEHGLKVPVVVLSHEELAEIAEGNPHVAVRGVDLAKIYVMFLQDAPSAAKIGTLDPERSPGDELVVRGRAIYLLLRNGAAKTKLTNDYFDRKLGTVTTSRNWRTVQKLLEMTSSTS